MSLVLDASVAVAWYITRNDPHEASIAQQALLMVMSQGAVVSYLWYIEVANAVIVAERRQVSDPTASAGFLADLESLPITMDNASPRSLPTSVLGFVRTYPLTASDVVRFRIGRSGRYAFDSQLLTVRSQKPSENPSSRPSAISRKQQELSKSNNAA